MIICTGCNAIFLGLRWRYYLLRANLCDTCGFHHPLSQVYCRSKILFPARTSLWVGSGARWPTPLGYSLAGVWLLPNWRQS